MFHDSDEQAMLRETVRRYLRDSAEAGERAWSADRWHRLATELGILGAPFPVEAGGLGGGLADALIVMEALGEHLIAWPYLQTVVMAGGAIAAGGGPGAAGRLAAIAAGETVVAVAHDEGGARRCVHDVGLRATAAGDGSYRLHGHKPLVRAAPWATHLLVSARTAGGRLDRDGVSLFLVGARRRGIAMKPARTIDGWDCADIAFDDVEVAPADLVGRPGEGTTLLEAMAAAATAALCAEGLGLMRSMLDQTIAHARQRRQFGKPLASFQVLQHRLVDMRCAIEHATSIARAAAAALANRDSEGPLVASAAKFVVNGALNFVGRAAVQIHGAIGMMEETPIAQAFRRATVLQREGGSADDHLARFARHAGMSVPDLRSRTGADILARLRGDDGPEIERFKEQVASFIQGALTPELRQSNGWEVGSFATPAAAAPWQRKLAERGWAAPAWPREHGGPGWNSRQRQIFEEEAAFARAPRLPAMGLQMVAPVLMRYGTAEQKARFLPRILSGEDAWCQGYSEPGAGSDLAALQLRAVRDGEEYVLNGTKIWTTFAHFADWMFVLARTAQRERRQDGISFLLVPMTTPGLTVRPLVSISGDHEVNQVFFDDVRIPVANLVGEENEGWQVAKYLLEFERGVGHQVPALVVDLADLRQIARSEKLPDGSTLWDDGQFRRRFAALEMRTLAIRLTEERLVYSLSPGQNVGDFTAALMKLAWSEMAQEIDELTIEALGPLAAIDQQDAFERRDPSRVVGPAYARTPMRRYLNDRMLTIAGGSSEVLRTILAKLRRGSQRQGPPGRGGAAPGEAAPPGISVTRDRPSPKVLCDLSHLRA